MDVADDLRETDDVDRDGAGPRFPLSTRRADRLERFGDAWRSRFSAPVRGIGLEQLGADDRAGEIVRNELAELAGLDDVFPDPGETGRGSGEVGGHDIAAGKAVLDDLDVADVGREERLHLRAVHGGQKSFDLVGDLAWSSRKNRRRGRYRPISGHQRDEHAVRAAELALWYFVNVRMYSGGRTAGTC